MINGILSMVAFESSVNSYDSQTVASATACVLLFESSVNSYDSQTLKVSCYVAYMFESSVNSYDSQTYGRSSQRWWWVWE